MTAETLLQAQGLRKQFGDIRALIGLDLEVDQGELVGLVGPDGAGKTTAMRLLCGALRPDAGAVAVCGISLAEHPDRARENIGYLSQRFSLYEDLTVLENLRFFAEVRGLASSEWRPRTMEILDFVGLAAFADRAAGKLSGGMKQKLGLASALVHQPRLLLLDEPTGGVDPVTRQDFWQLIIRLVAEEQVGALVSTPYMDEATRCHRVGILANGVLVVEGAPKALRAQLKGRILELRGQPLSALRQAAGHLPDVEDVQAFGDRLHMRVREGQMEAVKAALRGKAQSQAWRLDAIKLLEPQLEDVFMAISQEERSND